MTDVQTAPKSGEKAVAVRRTDPLASLREDMDNLMQRVWRGAPIAGLEWPRIGANGWAAPAMDFSESDSAYTFTAELPGMDKDDIDVSVQDGMLVVSGEKRSELDETRDNIRHSERRYGQFQRAFSLPADAADSKVDAKYNNGVLEITVPRSPGLAKATKVQIR